MSEDLPMAAELIGMFLHCTLLRHTVIWKVLSASYIHKSFQHTNKIFQHSHKNKITQKFNKLIIFGQNFQITVVLYGLSELEWYN